MPAQWGSMAETVEASPLKYTSVFGSTVPRFNAKYYGASACKEEVYDINHAHKADLVTCVQRSPLKLSHMRPGRPRMTYAKPDTREEIDTNVAHKRAMVDMLPDMPINYSIMRSETERFKGGGKNEPAKPLDVVYDIDCGHKKSVTTGVLSSRQSYPVFRSKQQRFGKGSFLDVGSPSQAEYNTDTAHKKTMIRASHDSPFSVASMRSKADRFKVSGQMDRSYQEAQYNTDVGHKQTLATGVENTPLLYANHRKGLGRKPRKTIAAAADPETQYNTDCGPKTMMTTAVAKNQIPSSAVKMMTSRTKRFAKAVGESTDAQIDGGGYDIDCGSKMTMTTALNKTPIRYSNVRSKTSRFGKDHRDKLLDVVYDTDKGHKMCLTTACANTPNIFTAMNSTVPRWKPPKRDEPRAGAGEYYRPNLQLLEQLYDHFRQKGKLKQLEAEFAANHPS